MQKKAVNLGVQEFLTKPVNKKNSGNLREDDDKGRSDTAEEKR